MKNDGTDQPQVLVTGRLWLGADGARSIGTCLIKLLNEARQEIVIVAYRLTVAVPELITALESALARGCYVRIVRDRALEIVQSEEQFIGYLLRNYSTVCVWDFKELDQPKVRCSLHAKIVLVDRSKAILGSANFSRNGFLENHEMAILLSGSEARSIGIACDNLVENGLREGILIQRTER